MVAIPRYEEKYASNLKGGASQVSGTNAMAGVAEKLGKTLSGWAETIDKQEQAQEKQQSELRVSQARMQAQEYALQLRYDPEQGYLNQNSINTPVDENGMSLSLSDDYTQRYNNKINEIAQALPSAQERQAFQIATQADGIKYQEGLLQHQQGLYQAQEGEHLRVKLENSNKIIESQYNNPQAIAQETNKQNQSIRQIGAQRGYMSEQTEQAVHEQNSLVQTIIVQAAINNNDPQYAEEHLNRFGNQIDPEAHEKLQTALQYAKSVQYGKQVSDSYVQDVLQDNLQNTQQNINQYADNAYYAQYIKQRAKENINKDPRLKNDPIARASAQYEIDYAFAKKAKENKQIQNKTLSELTKALDENGGNYNSTSPMLRQNLTPENEQKLINYANYKINGKPVKQSDPALLINMADDDYLKDISDGEFILLQASMSEKDYTFYEKRRANLLNGEDGSGKPDDPTGLNFEKFNDIFDLRILSLRGINSSSDLNDPIWLSQVSQNAKQYVLTKQVKTRRQLNYKEMELAIDKWFIRHYKAVISSIMKMR